MMKKVCPDCGAEPIKFMDVYNCPMCLRPMTESELMEVNVP